MLILLPNAENDIKTAYLWYEKQQIDLGKDFIAEVEKSLNLIDKNHKLYPIIYKNIHRSLCKKFPYAIYFIKTKNDIVVIGIFHQRRKSVLWQTRVKNLH